MAIRAKASHATFETAERMSLNPRLVDCVKPGGMEPKDRGNPSHGANGWIQIIPAFVIKPLPGIVSRGGESRKFPRGEILVDAVLARLGI